MINLFIHAKNEQIRQNASSGGFCKAFLCYLIDSQIVDYVILTRIKENSSEPETIITNDKNKILTRTNSVYEYNNQIKILDQIEQDKKYCFIGLPCFVKYIVNQKKINKFENIILTISLLCNQAPSSKYKLQILQDYEIDPETVTNIDYRHGEHPGKLNVEQDDHNTQTYGHDSVWSRYNMKYCFAPECCRHCELYESTYADITVGDAWHTKYARDKQGWTKVNVNNEQFLHLINDAEAKDYIKVQKADPKIEIENKIVGKSNKKSKQKPNVLLHTFHYANNYGAILQAYALQEILKHFGRNVSFLNFYDKENKYCIEQNLALKQFHEKYIQSTKHYSSFEDLKKNPPSNINVHLSGSDQIFNTEGGFFNSSFLQKYHKQENKIAYAASFGIDYIHNNIETEFVELLSQFKNISVREYEGMELLNKYGIKSTLCLDPTLIVPKNFWNDFSLLSNLKISNKYNLLYSPYGKYRSEEFSKESLKLNNSYECILLDMRTDYCPIDFVYLFANAENIITDSYHGIIFSHIFNKNVLFVENNLKTRNSRFITLNKIFSDQSLYRQIKHESIKFLIDNTQKTKI